MSNENSEIKLYSHFLIFIKEKFTESEDYYFVKFEIYKISMLFFNDYDYE